MGNTSNTDNKHGHDVYIKMDKLIATYYEDCGVNDYYNDDGIGRFLQFIWNHNTRIEHELGGKIHPSNCKYLAFDARFPFHSDVIDVMYGMNYRGYITFYILQYCYIYNAVPSTQKIVKVLQNKMESDLSTLECDCICGGSLTKYMDSSALYDGTGVECDNCGKSGKQNEIFWHCNDDANSKHKDGYDICHYCATEITSDDVIFVPQDNDSLVTDTQPPQKKQKLSNIDLNDNIKDKCMRMQNIIDMYDGSNCAQNIDIRSAINDFLSLLQYYSNHPNEFEINYNQLSGTCDLKKCNIFPRHYRNRQIEKTEDVYTTSVHANVSSDDVFKYQILDKMHCFYRHSFDIGYRLSTNNTETLDETKQIHDDDDDEFNFINEDIMHLNETTFNKRTFCAANSIKLRNNTKYNQIQFCQEENKSQSNHKCNDNMSRKQAVFSFGTLFKYGDDDGKSEVYQKHVTVSPKFVSLKEELTQNNICCINQQQFTNEYKKAQVHFESVYCKKERAKQRIVEWQHKGSYYSYGLYDYSWQEITKEHLLSLMLYCNFDTLQNYLSKTYYSPKYIEKHNNYYHLAKNLKHCVNLFGRQIRDWSMEKFYHGISEKVIFPQIIGDESLNANVRIYCPLSTSSSLAVAHHFAKDNDGLIVEFGGDSWSRCKYFSTAWISDYPNEKEQLFIQNSGALSELVINNIIEVSGCEHEMILEALRVIEGIFISQDDDEIEEYDDNEEQQYLETLCDKLICHQLSHKLKKYEAFKSLNYYAQQLIGVYFNNKITVSMNHAVVKRKYIWFWKLLFRPKDAWLKLDELIALFPNTATVRLYDVHITSAAFDIIVSDLSKIENYSQLKHVELHLLKTSELSAKSIVQHYSSTLLKTQSFIYINTNADDDNTLFILLNSSEAQFMKIIMDGMGQYYFEDTNNLLSTIRAIITLMLNTKKMKTSFDNETQKLLHQYCNENKRVTIFWKAVLLMSAANPFKDFYQNEFEWIKMKEVNVLFPNLEGIWVFDINLSLSTMKSIIQYLKVTPQTKIKNITIYPKKKSRLSALDAVAKYQADFESIHFCIGIFDSNFDEEIVTLDNKMICIEHKERQLMAQDNQQRMRWV